MRKKILYISYDGVLEPLGQSQVISYLVRLSIDFDIFLMSYEKDKYKNDRQLHEGMRSLLEKSNINWYPLKYHKWPAILSTVWDLLYGFHVGSKICKRYKIDIIHSRSYVPSIIALILRKNKKFVFDMRGFWADERVDGKLWNKNGFLYRIAKRFEKSFLLEADNIVTLTHASIKEIYNLEYGKAIKADISVIPTCVNTNIFRPIDNIKYPKDELVIGYVGSVGLWYDFEVTVKFINVLRSNFKRVKFIILNKNEHAYILGCLNKFNIPLSIVELHDVQHKDVALMISKMDVGVFFIRPTYSKIASAPTKFAEFIACGKPCVTNSGIGDMDKIIENTNTGILLKDFSDSELNAAAIFLIKFLNDYDLSDRCMITANRLFNINVGVKSYKNIYLS